MVDKNEIDGEKFKQNSYEVFYILPAFPLNLYLGWGEMCRKTGGGEDKEDESE